MRIKPMHIWVFTEISTHPQTYSHIPMCVFVWTTFNIRFKDATISITKLRIMTLDIECSSTERHFSIVMLSGIVLNVIYADFFISIVTLSAVMLSAKMLSVVNAECHLLVLCWVLLCWVSIMLSVTFLLLCWVTSLHYD